MTQENNEVAMARDKLMIVFRREPQRSFYIDELATETQTSRRRVRDVLKNLVIKGKIDQLENTKSYHELQRQGINFPGNTRWCWRLKEAARGD